MQPDPSNNSRVAIYARVSTEEQKDGQTIDSQVAELMQYAKAKTWTVVDVYKDEGWSGSLLARPELDRLRDQSASGSFTKVLVNDVDRLARDVTHLGIIKRDVEKNGVELVFRKLPAEKSPTYNLMVNILGSFAEFEREMIIDRTRRGRRHHIEVRQKMVGCLPSYGYRYVKSLTKSESCFEVVPEEAAVVREMFDWVDKEGLSIKKVVQRLNDGPFKPRKSPRWAISTVARMLHNETYAGLWYYNKNYSCEPLKRSIQSRYHSPKTSRRKRPREDWWRPVPLTADLIIIKREQWDRVQKQISMNAAVSRRNSKHFYLLKGLLKCGGCLGGFTGQSGNNRFVYRCYRRCKKIREMNSDRLEDLVWTATEEIMLDPRIILPRAFEIYGKTQKQVRDASNEVRSIERSVANMRTEEERIMLAYRQGVLTPLQLGEELQKLKERKEVLERRQREIEIPSSTAQMSSPEEFCSLVAARMDSFTLEERQRFLNLIIERVIVHNDEVRIIGIVPLLSKTKYTDSNSKAQISESSLIPINQRKSVENGSTTKPASETNFERIGSPRSFLGGTSNSFNYGRLFNVDLGRGLEYELVRHFLGFSRVLMQVAPSQRFLLQLDEFVSRVTCA